MNRRILIVGPSASGKTTVAESLARELAVPLIHMDDFRRRPGRIQPTVQFNGKTVRNYEDPSLWDPIAIACKLRAFIRDDVGFVAEGNHLLAYPEIAALPDTERYYLDVPFKVSVMRRRTRHRFSPADESFALIGEQQTALHVAPQKLLPGVHLIDGTLPPANVVAQILAPVSASHP